MKHQKPLYDVTKTFYENRDEGPFGDYADGNVYEDIGEPKEDFFGQPVYVPFGIAAGPLTLATFMDVVFDKGYDIATFKSVRTHEYPCLEVPNVLPVSYEKVGDITQTGIKIPISDAFNEPISGVNSFGIPSLPPELWQPEIQKSYKSAKSRKGKVVLAALQGTKSEKKDATFDDFLNDHVAGAKMLEASGASLIEVNTSCPNEGRENLLCFAPQDVEKIFRALKKELPDVQFIVKITHFDDDGLLREFVERVGPMCAGISAINTIMVEAVGENNIQAFNGAGRAMSGAHGMIVQKAGLTMTEKLAHLRQDFHLDYKIIGIGGVLSAQDYLAYRSAGADSVMAVTGPLWNAYLAQEIKKAVLT